MIINLGRFFAGVMVGISMLLGAFDSSAELVSDSQTNILDGIITNASGFGVGNIGSRTALILRNSAILTNSGTVMIGNNTTASSNLMSLTAGAFWTNNGNIHVGYQGSYNRLEIVDSTVANLGGYLGNFMSANSNLLLVSGANARMSNSSTIYAGYNGSFNQLIVSNGAGFTCNSLSMGFYGTARSNLVLVAGVNSFFKGGDFTLYNKSNLFCVADGAQARGLQTTLRDGAGVLVTGAGSLFSNMNFIMLSASNSSLKISSGAVVVDQNGIIGQSGNASSAVVTGTNSFWSNSVDLVIGGSSGPFAQLKVENGGKVSAPVSYIGSGGSNCIATITDPGTVWTNDSSLYVGNDSAGNQLVISNSACVYARTLHVGENSGSSNNLVVVDGGTLTVTNLVTGSATMEVRRGTLLVRSGLVDIDRLVLITGSQSLGAVLGGRLRAKQMIVGNGAPFVVGGDSSVGTLELLPGTSNHQFNNGLVIATNGFLTGYGTSSGNLYVGAGGVVGPDQTNQSFAVMTFSSIVFSNGALTTLKLDPARGNDSLFAHGTVTFGGTLQVIRTNASLPANNFSAGDSFPLFSATSYTGQFTSIIPVIPGPGLKWNTNQLSVDGTLRVIAANSGAPTISLVATTLTNITMLVVGGISYTPCYLLSTTNLALPFTSWERWATNYYDASGSTMFTNAIDSPGPQRYFAIEAQ